eukprot:scaffold318423_cov27-Prasinocladus_malaysianus.AAC.1
MSGYKQNPGLSVAIVDIVGNEISLPRDIIIYKTTSEVFPESLSYSVKYMTDIIGSKRRRGPPRQRVYVGGANSGAYTRAKSGYYPSY